MTDMAPGADWHVSDSLVAKADIDLYRSGSKCGALVSLRSELAFSWTHHSLLAIVQRFRFTMIDLRLR